MENESNNIKKGDLVERTQGKKVIDLGLVLEAYKRLHKQTGWFKVYWQGLKKEEDVHITTIRKSTKKVH